ncbi:MAG: response regulator transcription factor [Methanomassiliicoccales archaeon]
MAKVLCVDDDEGLVEVLADMLSYSGFETVTVTSGEACLQALEEGLAPDLILLDIMMSPMDGWQTLNRIRENVDLCALPVLMLTGKYPTMKEVSSYGLLFDGYLMKPFAMQTLVGSVNDLLERIRIRESIINRGIDVGMDERSMCEFRRLFSIGVVLDHFENIITDGSFDRQSMHHVMDRLNDLLKMLGEHGVDVHGAAEI